MNKISSIIVEGKRVEKKDYFLSLSTKETWERPSLDSLEFEVIDGERATWIERNFEEEEVWEAIHALAGDKAPGPDGFPMVFF